MNQKNIRSVLILCSVGIGVFLFWQGRQRSSVALLSPGKVLRVTASFYPLAFFAQEVGGARAEVVNITPAGAEPHEYEPTAGDIARIEASALFISMGNGLEVWSSALERALEGKNIRMIHAASRLATAYEEGENDASRDVHVWLSPLRAQKMVEVIAEGFVSADPLHAQEYRARAGDLGDRLGELDALYRRNLSVCASRDIITSHAAFGYLARDYGLYERSIAGISPDEEPGTKQLADLVVFARTHDVHTVFFERTVSPKLSQTLAREIGGGTGMLDPLEGLTADDLASGKNYFTEMRRNLVTLEQALRCKQ